MACISPTSAEARVAITRAITKYYAESDAELSTREATKIAEVARVLGDLYEVNVFPAMKVTWDTYPNHLGHHDSPGCFRCHDDGHDTADGKTISQDCDTCHSVLAEEEVNPEILEKLNP